ncbi:MAG: PilZ domain-containing protein [Thermodesulfobacteriota bacterium]
MAQEKRRFDRFDTLHLSCVQVGKDDSVIFEGMGRTLNVSKGGILLEIVSDQSLSGHIILRIALEGDLIVLSGNIVHCDSKGLRLYHAGIEFLKMSEKAAMILDKFIKVFEERSS